MKLIEQLVELAMNNETTGVRLLDAVIADGNDLGRMATVAELQAVRTANRCFKTESDKEIEEYFKTSSLSLPFL